MAAVIIIFEKDTAPEKKKDKFFDIIDSYVEDQDFIVTDDFPKTYFITKQTPPQLIRGIITTIKNTKDCNSVVDKIYFSTNLTKG